MPLDIPRPGHLLPPKCECPCPTAAPACDCTGDARFECRWSRWKGPFFYCRCCERSVTRCFRVEGTELRDICKDCEAHQVETGTTDREYPTRWWETTL